MGCNQQSILTVQVCHLNQFQFWWGLQQLRVRDADYEWTTSVAEASHIHWTGVSSFDWSCISASEW